MSDIYYVVNYSPNYLAHYGVLGMKWGVRRYQNADGTLTEAGKKRYINEYTYGYRLTDKGEKKYRNARGKAYYKTIRKTSLEDPITRKFVEKYKDLDFKLDSVYEKIHPFEDKPELKLTKKECDLLDSLVSEERKLSSEKSAIGKKYVDGILKDNPNKTKDFLIPAYPGGPTAHGSAGRRILEEYMLFGEPRPDRYHWKPDLRYRITKK